MYNVDIFAIDFDSTFTEYESFDYLMNSVIAGHTREKEIKEKLKHINSMVMKSNLDFRESFTMKIGILQSILKKEHFEKVSKFLEDKITPEITKLLQLIKEKNKKVIVLSNSFKILMQDIMKKNNIDIYFANKITFSKNGRIEDFDDTNIMANNNGKINTLRFLKETGLILSEEKIMMIGDGVSDLDVYAKEECDYFINFAIYKNRKLKKHRFRDDNNFIVCKTPEEFYSVLEKIQ